MTSALITGISGFIGRTLASTLRAQGIAVCGVERNKAQTGADESVVCGDITDSAFVDELIQTTRPNIVFHLAANKTRTGGIEDFRQGVESNLLGTLNLAEVCFGKSYFKRFVSMGTCEEYGHSAAPFSEDMCESPISAYSFSKTAATHLLQTLHRTYQFPAVVLRPSLAYGPGQATDMFLPALIQSLLKREHFAMSGGRQTRDYVYLDDLVQAIILAATMPGAIGKIINISSGVPILLKDLALLAAKKISANAENLIGFGEKDYRASEIMDYVASCQEAERILGWKPRTSLDEGLASTIEHYRRFLGDTTCG